MNVKELAEKLNKKIPEVKKLLADKGVMVKAATSTIDDMIAHEIINVFFPKKQTRVIKVIKKAVLDAVVSEEGDTAAKKVSKVLEQSKKAAEKIEEAKKEQQEKPKEHAAKSPDGAEKSETAGGPTETVLVADLLAKKKDTHLPKERVFKDERVFTRKEKSTDFDAFKPKQKKRKSKYKKLKDVDKPVEQVVEDDVPVTEITLTQDVITLIDLAALLKVKVTDIISALLKEGRLMTINQEADLQLASKIGELFNIKVKADFSEKEDSKIKYDVKLMEQTEIEDTTENLVVRPPIVTIMGHVDHGKTKLLDAIRSSRIVEGEAGGITQHIGAYQVEVHGKKVTFLDTPGHEAFTMLRARGSQVTDIVILVVAANDGIMPQTIEAIDHAKAAAVPIIVAINKVDLPEANPEKVKQQLTEHELLPEEWGGKTICCNISAKQKTGIDNLLEMILLTAEVEELKANPNKRAQGIVIESQLSKQKGPVATVLIKAGTLKKGDPFVVGHTFGRIRAMFNDLGKEVEAAPPSCPVEILGITDVPRAGEIFQVLASEKEARALAEQKAMAEKEALLMQRRKTTLAALSQGLQKGELKTMNIILKADVQGSLEALTSSIQKLSNEKVNVNIIHGAIGIVNKSDVMLAKASEAVIFIFNAGVQDEARALAGTEGIEIREYDIIYKLLEDLELAMKGLLEPEYEEVEIGKAEIRQVFKSSKSGAIAGCFVTQGFIKRNCKIKLQRAGKTIYEGKLDTLKRFKDDAKEVQSNFECGLTLDKFEDFKEGDVLTAFEMREKVRS